MSDDEMPVGTFYFTHGTNQLLFTTTLGLYEDDIPLLHDNFEENADRLFRSSFLKPFSVNFEFVLYDCDEEGGEEPVRRLLTLHNEAGVTLPGCDEPLCRWDQFQENYQVQYDIIIYITQVLIMCRTYFLFFRSSLNAPLTRYAKMNEKLVGPRIYFQD